MDVGPAIEMSSIRKEYGSQTAVDGLNLTVPNGVIFGFLGPNGAGKTTTIRMLATLERPTDGTAMVAGESIQHREHVTPKIGYVPEQPPIYPELTGRENLEYMAGLRGIDDDETIQRWFDRFDLIEAADRAVAKYSKGMRQKLSIAGALVHEPDVLFLDEPTTGLDPRAVHTVKRTIADTAQRGTTVFLSTHILPVVEELADRVAVLDDGQLVAEGPTSKLMQSDDREEIDGLEDVFLRLTDNSRKARAAER